MEVGAVKQAFNNELILLKKKLNQAKIQTIHKLTRKAKTLVEKKAPDAIKEKLKRKAESAVKEVLLIKKIKAKDLGKFIVTHKGELTQYLNKPHVDLDKACARLLLHKSLQDKYKLIRERFTDVAIEDLLMSRQERRKLKKEAKEKQKNKKKNKDKKVVNAEGDWDVNDVLNKSAESSSEDEKELDDELSNSEVSDKDNGLSNEIDEVNSIKKCNLNSANEDISDKVDDDVDTSENSNDSDDEEPNVGKFVKIRPVKSQSVKKIDNLLDAIKVKSDDFKLKTNEIDNKKSKKAPKPKDSHKNKNFNEKILLRKFKKDKEALPVLENKVVDPFFITSSGENYMSVAEPRQPDEVKEIHKDGNRKLRRAVMFGHVPKNKSRQDDFRLKSNRFNNNAYDDNSLKFNNKTNRSGGNYDRKNNFQDRNAPFKGKDDSVDTKSEKLHPSWEAKKRQSGILPFQGKKIVFDEN